jgi:hypothetical protein
MQYPAGTSFAVDKQKLNKAVLSNKLFFKQGIYTIRTIRKNQDKIVYTFTYNNTTVDSLSCGTCQEVDKVIAFCRNEPLKEPVNSLETDL